MRMKPGSNLPHKVLFFLLVLLLPTQLGRHFWPQWSYVLGLRLDYLSPTIYLTDLLTVGVLGLWFWKSLKTPRRWVKTLVRGGVSRKYWWIFSLFLFLFVNCFFAQNRAVALYKFAKIIELSLLGLYVAKNKIDLSLIPYPLSLATIYSSLIAIAQFVRQSSLNGIFYWLGERTFSVATPGIAKAVVDGRLLMRPYATFPHPNVLAGFILVSLTLIATCNMAHTTRKVKPQNTSGGIKKALWWLAVILAVVAILISFSRSAWLGGLAVGLWMVGGGWRERTKKKKLFLITVYLLLMTLFGFLLFSNLPFSTTEAFSQRLQLAKVAISMVKKYPLAGVGLNNFIVRLLEFWRTPENIRLLQPVHNIFLLMAAETGLIGLLIFLWFLILTYKKLLIAKNQPLLLLLSVVLALGLTDHYWFTLQQGQLLFSLVLGLSWGLKISKTEE